MSTPRWAHAVAVITVFLIAAVGACGSNDAPTTASENTGGGTPASRGLDLVVRHESDRVERAPGRGRWDQPVYRIGRLSTTASRADTRPAG